MHYQIITLIFIAATILSAVIKNKKIDRILIIGAITCACILIYDLRLTDYTPYETAFYNITETNFRNEGFLESGWIWLMRACETLGLAFQDARILLIAFCLAVKYYFFSQFLRLPALVMVIYVALLFYPDSYMLRSTLAGNIIILAIVAGFKFHRTLSSLALMAVAVLIHYTAIVVAPFIAIRCYKISKVTSLSLICIIIIVSTFGLAGIAMDAMTNISLPYLQHKIELYSGSEQFQRNEIGMAAVLWATITFGFIVLRKANWEYTGVLIILGIAGLFGLLAFSDATVIANRIFRFFAPVYPLMLGLMIERLRPDFRLVASLGVLTISFAASFIISPHTFLTVS